MWHRAGEAERLKARPQACRPCHPFVPGVLGRHPISSHPHSPESLPEASSRPCSPGGSPQLLPRTRAGRGRPAAGHPRPRPGLKPPRLCLDAPQSARPAHSARTNPVCNRLPAARARRSQPAGAQRARARAGTSGSTWSAGRGRSQAEGAGPGGTRGAPPYARVCSWRPEGRKRLCGPAPALPGLL